MESFSSDEEFWEDLEEEKQWGRVVEDLDVLLAQDECQIRSESQNIRMRKGEELTLNSIVIKKQAEKAAGVGIQKEEREYKQRNRELERGIKEIRGEMHQNESYLRLLQECEEDLISVINDYELTVVNQWRVPKRRSEYNFESDENKEKTARELQMKAQSHLEICKNYRETTAEAALQIEKITEHRKHTENAYKAEIDNIKENSRTKCEELKKTLNELYRDRNNLRRSTGEIIEEKESLHVVQTSIIQSLQEELKNAKMVLQNENCINYVLPTITQYMKSLGENKENSLKPPKASTTLLSKVKLDQKTITLKKATTPYSENSSFEDTSMISFSLIRGKYIHTPSPELSARPSSILPLRHLHQ